MCPITTRLRCLRRSFLREEAGASAVEFALLAPVLIFALLATADVGLAVHQKLLVDQSLRAGSEAAIRDFGQDAVRDVVSAAISRGNPSTYPAATRPTVAVVRFCACPDSISTAVSCTSGTCSAKKPNTFYRLTATKVAENRILPTFQLRSSMLVAIK